MQSALSPSVFFETLRTGKQDFVRSIQLEVLSGCACKCVMCKQWQDRISYTMSPEQLETFFKDYKRLGGLQINLTGGDPLYYKDFVKVFSQDFGLRLDITTTMITNDKEKLDLLSKFKLITLSISGVGDTYKKIHGVDAYEMVKNNLIYIRKKGMNFKTNTVLSKENLENIDWVEPFIEDMNLLQPKFVTLIQNLFDEGSFTNIADVVKIFNDKAKFKFSNASMGDRNKTRKKEPTFKKYACIVPYLHWHIKSSGDVYPCCIMGGEVGQDLDPNFCFGNIFKDKLEDIYKNGTDFVDKKGEDIYNGGLCKKMCLNGVRYYSLNRDFFRFKTGLFVPRI
jgi:MoaA/NifB/PqqE/SkfB family radical SAM enzyme